MWIRPTDDPQWIVTMKAYRETCDAMDDLYSRWLCMQAEWAADVVEEARTEQLAREETEIMLAMAATPVPHRWLEQKLEVLDHVMFHDRQSSWIDRRDELLLNSIKADVKALD